MEWSTQQEQALKAVDQWLKDDKAPQVFRLFGVAGTGKSYLARHFAEYVDGTTLFMAYTGKAAYRMNQLGCPNASTIHKAIYKPMVVIEKDDQGNEKRKLKFILNPESPVRDAALVIVDECSMVNEQMGNDLLAFGTKVLVLGDPAQLPPVKGSGFFTDAKPDMMLTEIHRQAKDNPIIELATLAREGKKIKLGDYGESEVIKSYEVEADDVLSAEQIIVGRNLTRKTYNNRVRDYKDIESGLPVVGDRLVCLRNNHEIGLLNGSIWFMTEDAKPSVDNRSWLSVVSEDGETDTRVEAHNHYFLGHNINDMTWKERYSYEEFDYGYAMTAHKAQGSGFSSVLLFDESFCFRDNAWRWMYTGITRAIDRIVIVK